MFHLELLSLYAFPDCKQTLTLDKLLTSSLKFPSLPAS